MNKGEICTGTRSLILKIHLLIRKTTKKISTKNQKSKSVYLGWVSPCAIRVEPLQLGKTISQLGWLEAFPICFVIHDFVSMTQGLDNTVLRCIFAVHQCKVPPCLYHHAFEVDATHNTWLYLLCAKCHRGFSSNQRNFFQTFWPTSFAISNFVLFDSNWYSQIVSGNTDVLKILYSSCQNRAELAQPDFSPGSTPISEKKMCFPRKPYWLWLTASGARRLPG